MKTLEVQPTAVGRAAAVLGTAMMLAWTFLIGILGFALLFGAYYAMQASSQSLLVICCFGLSLPLLLTVVFGLLSVADAMLQKIAVEDAPSSPSLWDKRKYFRILYQAYYL